MMTLVIPVQAQLPELLDASRDATSWVVTVALLVSAASTPISGRLGDIFGRRRIVVVLLGVLIAGSLVAALSHGVVGVIIGRALQGTVMGVVPLGISIMRDVLPRKQLGSSIALMSATMGIGGALGLPLAAWVAEHLSFQTLFWTSAALGLLSLALILRIVPRDSRSARRRVDILGAVGLALGMSGVLLALSQGGSWGWLSFSTLGVGASGLIVLLLWAAYQQRTKDPLLDLRVASRPAVLFTNTAALCMGFALFTSNIAFPQILSLPVEAEAGFGLSLIQAALAVMPSGIMILLISPISGRLEQAFEDRRLFTMGAAAVVVAFTFISLWSTEFWHFMVANALVGVGIGFTFAAMPLVIMRSVPPEDAGASNGLNALFRSLGTATAAAVMGGILASITAGVGDAEAPTALAFRICFWLAIASGVVAVILSLLIPKAKAESPVTVA